MKLLSISFFLFVGFIGAGTDVNAQEKLIILVRHAEKMDAQSQDPDLSEEGRQRAERLIKAIGKFRPGAFYSTDFKRTRATVTPLADKRKKAITIYDPRKPQDLVSVIMQSKTKRHVVAGHSNTVPGLANLIAKKEIFKNLDESEYTVIWLIRVSKDGKIKKLELLNY